jgi:copper(I)-binding protein
VLEVQIVNHTAHDIEIVGLTSPSARRAMLHYDLNMCSGTHTMLAVPAMTIGGRNRLGLGLKGNGAMLLSLTQSLNLNSRMLVNVSWKAVDRTTTYVSSFFATVVAKPRGLDIANSMATMRM